MKIIPALAAALFAALSLRPAHANAVPQTIVSPLGHAMTLKFDEEFDAMPGKDGRPGIDLSKWQTTFWQGSGQRTLIGNGEAQYYMDEDYAGRGELPASQRVNPFSWEKPGVLTISATQVPESMWRNYWMGPQRRFASGLLVSDKAFTFQYGYVEGRFKLPGNRGAWPAFWLLGDDPSLGDANKAHEWPPEIDIFEFMGHWRNKFDSAIHPRKGEHVNNWVLRYDTLGKDVDISQDFHTWGVEWNADEIVFTFDGKIWTRGKTPPSLRRRMYLLINLAVGGNWYAGEMSWILKQTVKPWEVDEKSMPWKMECDYVRVYQAE